MRDLWQPFMLTAIPCFLILKEPDLGTALFLGMISISVVLIAKVYWKSLVIFVCSFFLAAPLIWFGLKEYQQKRVLSFLSPDMDPLGAGYHINQSKIAIGSGQFWGKGFLEGTQTRLHFLPEQHTDFAFSVLAEEWGLIGSACASSHLPLHDLMGPQYSKKFKRQVWFYGGCWHRNHCFLAGRNKRRDGYRALAGGWNPPPPFQLWRFIFDFNHGGHGDPYEYQHETFYVSVDANPDEGIFEQASAPIRFSRFAG